MPLFQKKMPIDDSGELHEIVRDIAEADFIPYACHWDPHTIATRNGELLQTIKIPGFSHEQSSAEEDGDLRSHLRAAILSVVDSPEYAIWIHTVRSKKNLATAGKFKRDFAGYLDRFWNDNNDWEHQFSNTVYLTIVHEGQGAELSDMNGVVRGILPRIDAHYRERFLGNALKKLNTVTEKILPMLKSYGAKRLGVVKRDGVYYSEVSAFLGKLVNTIDQDFPVEEVDLAESLTDCDIMFAHNAMEVRSHVTGKRRYGALLTIKEYREISSDILEGLLRIPAEFIISQCFHFSGAKQILKSFEYQKALFAISKASALAEQIGLPDIFASDKGRATDFGQHQLSIFLPADSVKVMESAVAKASSALSKLGMIPMREDLSLEESFWAQLPANFEFIKRMRPINTARLGGLANLDNAAVGTGDGNHWGTAVTTLWTASHTPYFFNFHVGDKGHTTIVGPPSAGKTELMNFLLAEARKFDGQLFFFDTRRSSEIFLRSLGGAYYNPSSVTPAQPYAQLSLNPFQLEDTPENREFLRRWLLSLAASDDTALATACDKAITAVMARPKAERELRICVEALRTENAAFAELFAAWTGTGQHAALFDHAADSLLLSDKVYGFEMQDLLEQKTVVIPVVSYLLHRMVQALDGTPAIIVINEAWTLLDDPYFIAHLGEWLERVKAKNAMVIFATEQGVEIGSSPVNKVLMANITTQIFLPDENADTAYMEIFDLSTKDVSYLGVMNTEDRHFLLKQDGSSLVIALDLSGMSDILAVLSATQEHLEIMERVIAAHSLKPSEWMPKFLELI